MFFQQCCIRWLIIAVLVLLSCVSVIFAADVSAPAKDKTFILKLKNFGIEDMVDVNIPKPEVKNNPYNLITIKSVTPAKGLIAGGNELEYKVEFDVACPPNNPKSKIEKEMLKFLINTTAKDQDVLFVKNCGFDQTTCTELEAEIEINTELFSVTCSPPGQSIKKGETKSHTISITNRHPEYEEAFNILISGSGNGWDVNPTSFSNIVIAGGSSQSLTFNVTNNDAAEKIDLSISVTETGCGITKSPENIDNAENPGHVTDHPDDNYSVTSSEYPTPWLYDSESPIGVLSSGWGEGLNYLLGKFNVSTALVKPDLTILNEPGKSINDLDVLLIGSAGLDGLESSPIFRKKLADFVDQGGVLIDLTAKNGYEFAALPGGEVAGYGWNEDQSCLSAAVSMVKYHQMLSSQTSTDLTANVDGYFTKWPASATVLLQRNKNGMPALITYPFGKGAVIATTIFEDWAYGHNQSTASGQNLIRDMVAWARMAKTLPEFAIGASVAFPINVINATGVEAQKVAFVTLDPNRNVVKRDTITLAIPANDIIEAAYSSGTAPSNLGIWYVQHTLLSDANDVVQEEQLGQMFAVSNPAGVAKTPEIAYSVNSDAEYYASGSEGVFTITVWNHSDANRSITAWWSFPHNYWTRNEDIYGSPGTTYPWHNSNLKETLEVPANSSTTFAYSIPVYSYDRLWAQFADESDKLLGTATRGFYSYSPSCDVKVFTDKQEYKSGDDVALAINLKNMQSITYTGNINIIVLNPENTKVWENNCSVELPYNMLITQNAEFSLPTGSVSGAYTVKVEVTKSGNRAGSYSAHFIIPEAFLALTPNLPGVLQEGDNSISFSIENYGLVDVTAGTLEARLLNPAGSVVWSDIKPFSLEGGLISTVNYSLSVASLEFGTYQLLYRAHYDGLYSKEARKDIPSACQITVLTDKSNYKIKETAVLDIDIMNIGRFQYSTIACNVSLPGTDAVLSTLSLKPGQNARIPAFIVLPETMTAGVHTGTITLGLPSGTTMTKPFTITIPQPKIVLSLDSMRYNAGDGIPVIAENIGGTPGAAQCSIELRDARGVIVAKEEQAMNLGVGEKAMHTFFIPEQATDGVYELTALAFNQTVPDTTRLAKSLSITGVLASLQVRTDKKLYASDDTKTAFADISLRQGKIDDGSLYMSVERLNGMQKAWSTFEDWQGAHLSNINIEASPGDAMIGQTGAADNPVAYWSFDEGSGDTAFDASGNVRHAKIFGATWIDSGRTGKALSFDGSNDYVEFGGNQIDGNEPRTVSAWFKAYTSEASQTRWASLVSIGGDAGTLTAYLVCIRNDDGSCAGMEGRRIGGHYWMANTCSPHQLSSIGINQWHHIALTHDGSRQELYLDGVKVGESQHTLNTLPGPTRIGCRLSHAAHFNGAIDEVAIYDRALSETEIRQSYLGGQGMLMLTYDAGQFVQWDTASFSCTTPESTSVKIATRTAETEEALAVSPWSLFQENARDAIHSPPGRWLQVKALLATTRESDQTPVLHDCAIEYMAMQQIWTSQTALNVADSQSFAIIMPEIPVAGHYRISGEAKSSINQTIGSSKSTFFISNEPVMLSFALDKNAYKPGDQASVHGRLINNSNDPITGLPVEFMLDGVVVFLRNFDMAVGESLDFDFSVALADRCAFLTATAGAQKIIERIEVVRPELKAVVYAPSVAGREPVEFSVYMENPVSVPASITLNCEGEVQAFVIPPGQSANFKKIFALVSDTTIHVTISGDVTIAVEKNILMGAEMTIELIPRPLYPEGLVSIPYRVINTGSRAATADITFAVGPQTFVRQVCVPPGGANGGDLVLNQVAGEYTATYSSIFGNGSANYRVAPDERLRMQVTASRYSVPRVLILRDGTSESSLSQMLVNNGLAVTTSAVMFYQWDGTNPAPDSFDVIILPAASNYNNIMAEAGQTALVNFVHAGGGFISAEYITRGAGSYGNFALMSELLLFDPSQWTNRYGTETFMVAGTHPITDGISAPFAPSVAHYGNGGGLKESATAVLSGSLLPNVIAVKQYGAGRIAQFAIRGNYIASMANADTTWRRIVVNAVHWAGKSYEGHNVHAEIVVANEGSSDFDGQLSSSTSFFAKTDDLLLSSGETKIIKYDLDISSVEPSTYTFKSAATVGGKALEQASQSFVIGSSELELAAVPSGNNFSPGQEVTFTFEIKNKGMVEGKADIGLKVVELYDGDRTSWVAPGIEKQESFTLQIPDDYPEGEYKAEFKLNGNITEIPFAVSGVKLDVVASLDKPIYQYGEIATLSLAITNSSALTPAVYAKASSNGDEDREDFALAMNQTIQLQLPVHEGTLSRIAYGIYMASGRAIHLNTIYIRIMKGAITLYTDKSLYITGETVTANVATEQTGDLVVTTTTGYTNTIAVTGPTSFTFVLPDEIASGTQSINYQFNEHSGFCNFDVLGYSLKVLNVALSKQTYNPIDQLSAAMTVKSNKAVSAVVKGWLYSPAGPYTDLFEVTRDLAEGETDVNVSAAMSTSIAGTHKLVYGIYSSGTNLTLATGSKAFDVKPSAIIAVSTDKSTYNEMDEAVVTVNTYACGEYAGTVEIVNGGDIVASQAVILNGASDVVLEAGPLAPGIHNFIARLKNETEVASEKGIEIAVVDMNSPAAPAGLVLAMDGDIAGLAWNTNTEPDIAGYNAFRNGDKLNAVPFKLNSFRNEGLVAGVSYTYHVTAVDRNGNESSPSASVVAQIDNTAPAIAMVPSSDVVSTTPITFTYSVVDDIDPNPAVSASHPTPTIFRRAGIYPISVIAIDVQGNRAEKAITLTLNIPNSAPQLELIADKSIDEGHVLAFSLLASDPEGDALVFSADNLPAGANLNASSGLVTWMPGYDQAGEYNITFMVTDDGTPAKSATQPAKITVANVNRPPVMADLRDTTINEGDMLRLTIQAQDPEGDPLVLSTENLPEGALVDAVTGSFVWVPDYNQAGNYANTRFIISDNGTPVLSDTAVIAITVNNINRAPVLAAIGNRTVNEGELLTFSIAASDSDGNNLSYSAGNLPSGATFDQITLEFFWRPDYQAAGIYPNVVFTVTDDGQPRMSDQEDITITIGDVNLPPVLAAIGDKTVNEGDTLGFRVSASDPDGNALIYLASNLPTGAAFDESTQQFFWVPEFSRDGIYPDILFTVIDNGQPAASDQEAISITVGNVNRPPKLIMIGNKSVLEGDSLKFAVTATDPDNDSLIYSAGNLPDGSEFNSVTQNFRWVPAYDQAGNYPDVLFTVTDKGQPQASDQEAITISVGDMNRPPVLAQIGDKHVNEGDTLKFSITATDPDGNQIVYSAGNLPLGARFYPATQTFEWIVLHGHAGTYPGVWFEATDNGYPQESDHETISIAVGEVNRAPAMGLIGDKTIAEGENLSFTVTATDPDGDNLVLSAANLPSGALFSPASGVFSWTPSVGQAGSYFGILFSAYDGYLSDSEAIAITVHSESDGCNLSTLEATPSLLWPPNHKMVGVSINPTLSGGCSSACRIISVTSNEPEKCNESADKSPDWNITGNLTLDLRAERLGKGSDRIYTITIECIDANGYKSTGAVAVTVPHDNGK